MTRKQVSFVVVGLIILSTVSYVGYSVAGGSRSITSPVNLHVIALGSGKSSPTSRSFLVKGLIQPVTISIDASGLAHVYALNNHDLFFAQGYYTASNRLFQMEIEAMSVSGNFSAFIGPAGVSSDLASRMQQIPETALQLEQFYQSHYPRYYFYLKDYADGVNAYINSTGFTVPLGFKLMGVSPVLWTVFDTLVWQQNMAFGLINGKANTLRNDIFYNTFGYANLSLIWPDYPHFTKNITVVPGDGTVNGYNLTDQGVTPSYFWSQNLMDQWATGVNLSLVRNLTPLFTSAITNMTDPYLNVFHHTAYSSFVGSNEWIVTSSYSSSGQPMLENDPHLGLTLPNLFLPMQLVDPHYNVTGWELVGTPGILIGHTKYTSWGLTTPGGYNALEYLEILNGSSYLFNGTWYPLTPYNFTLLGKSYSINYTNNGPLIARQGNVGISFNWAGGRDALDLIAIFRLDMSRSYSDMLSALQYWGSPPQNFALVSLHNSGIITAGRFPLVGITLPDGMRVEVVGSASILNGSLQAYEPAGFVPFRYLPQTKNPARGYAFAPNQPLAGLNYPYPIIAEVGGEGGRAHTMNDFLASHPQMTIRDMMQLQGNVSDSFARMFVPLLLNALSGMSMNSTQDSAYSYLAGWNYTDYVNEVGPTVYWYLRMEIYAMSFQKIYAAHDFTAQGLPLIATTIYLAMHDPHSTWLSGNFTSLVQNAFNSTVLFLLNNIGSDVSTWTWGTVHLLFVPSLLYAVLGAPYGSFGPIPFKGGSHTISVAGVPSLDLQVPLSPATTSSVLKEISSPSTDQFYGVFPGGLSENFTSPFYDNQLPYWLNDSYYNMSNQPVILSTIYAQYPRPPVHAGFPAVYSMAIIKKMRSVGKYLTRWRET